MNLQRLIKAQTAAFHQPLALCGSSGPSSAELTAQSDAATAKAQAEADLLRTNREAQKAEENAKIVADQTASANADASRRAKNRTLLAGLDEEEGLVDPTAASTVKAKKTSLLGVL